MAVETRDRLSGRTVRSCPAVIAAASIVCVLQYQVMCSLQLLKKKQMWWCVCMVPKFSFKVILGNKSDQVKCHVTTPKGTISRVILWNPVMSNYLGEQLFRPTYNY